MRTPKNTSQEPAHHPEEATRWFNQWHVYRAIVDANWMAHREIFNAIRSWALMRYPGPFTLLDLGCGDARFIKSTFNETGLWAYTGVDASQAALAKARNELAGARFQGQLLEADMLASLREDCGPAAKTVDVILASYAVHHLPAREKALCGHDAAGLGEHDSGRLGQHHPARHATRFSRDQRGSGSDGHRG